MKAVKELPGATPRRPSVLVVDDDANVRGAIELLFADSAFQVSYRTGVAEALSAIMGHASYSVVARETLLAKSLFAVDELTGLVQASALVRPDQDVKGVELSSLKKKFKNRAFAAGVNRDEVEQGARELGVELETHMQNVLDAMKGMD